MAAHSNSRSLIPLAAVACLAIAMAAGFGGYSLAGSRAPEAVNLTGASGTSGNGVTIYACLASGKLTRVTVATAPICRAPSVLVQWTAQSGPASTPTPHPSVSSSSVPPTSKPTSNPTTKPTSPPSSPPATSTATSPSQPGAACVKTANDGSCGPYDYAAITGSADSTYVIQNIWNPIPGASQKLTSYSPGDWSVTANMPASNTAVVSYPDTQKIYTTTSNTPNKLSNFASITSNFTESMPSGGDNEAAYDIWTGDAATGNYAEEIMIWVDDHRNTTPLGTDLGTATFNGQTFEIWDSVAKGQTGTISFLLKGNESTGTVDVLSMLSYLAHNGYIPSDSGLEPGRLRLGDLLHRGRPRDVHHEPVRHRVILHVRLILLRLTSQARRPCHLGMAGGSPAAAASCSSCQRFSAVMQLPMARSTNELESLTLGNGAGGTGTPRNSHSGSQPSDGDQTRSRSGGTSWRTWSL